MTRRLSVGINLLWLRPGVVGGSEHYIVSILDELARRDDSEVEVHLYALADFVTDHPSMAGRFPVTVAPVSGHQRSSRVVVENLWLPSQVRRDGIDVMHHAGGTMPARSGPNPVLTLHDVQYADHPAYFGAVKLRWLRFVVPRSARRAHVIVTASEHTRNRVIDVTGAAEDRVVVMYHAIPGASTMGEVHAVSSSGPYVLYPAWTHPHKNHETLIRAMAQVEGVNLVMTGRAGAADAAVHNLIAELGLQERVHRLGHVGGEELNALYAGSLGLVFPSAYEGFGAPVAEAMIRGVPVICSSEASMPEVVGDAGLLVGSDDIEAWASAIGSLGDEQLRTELIDKGMRRAEAFAPQLIVDQMIGIWSAAARR